MSIPTDMDYASAVADCVEAARLVRTARANIDAKDTPENARLLEVAIRRRDLALELLPRTTAAE